MSSGEAAGPGDVAAGTQILCPGDMEISREGGTPLPSPPCREEAAVNSRYIRLLVGDWKVAGVTAGALGTRVDRAGDTRCRAPPSSCTGEHR